MSKLSKPPKVDRFAAPAKAAVDPAKIDPTGGRYGAGLIPGVSLCARGEALGHGMWIDDEFLQSIADAAETNPKLLKSRFTHPDLCSDGMGKAVGTIESVMKVGDQVYGDLHCYSSAHDAPDGDLAGYVMSLAQEDPTNFGLSIVFSHDWQAEDEFEDANTEVIEGKDSNGQVISQVNRFQSPDPLNVENLPHCRLLELRAADVVDEPAANPNGLFHRQNRLLADGGKLIDFVLGRSTEVPALAGSFGVDVAPERLKSFVSKYLASAGLSVQSAGSLKDVGMSKKEMAAGDNEDPKEDPKPEEKPEDNPADKKAESKADDAPADPGADNEDDSASKADKSKCSSKPDAELSEYCEAFGHENGAKYFLAGTSFKDAQTKEVASLRAALKERDEKLAAFAKAGVDPVAFTAASDKKRDESNSAESLKTQAEIDNRAAFAAANAKPLS